MYSRFTQFIEAQVPDHRQAKQIKDAMPDVRVTAWAIVGLATVADIGREVGLLTGNKRKALLGQVAKMLLDGQ